MAISEIFCILGWLAIAFSKVFPWFLSLVALYIQKSGILGFSSCFQLLFFFTGCLVG